MFSRKTNKLFLGLQNLRKLKKASTWSHHFYFKGLFFFWLTTNAKISTNRKCFSTNCATSLLTFEDSELMRSPDKAELRRNLILHQCSYLLIVHYRFWTEEHYCIEFLGRKMNSLKTFLQATCVTLRKL